MLLGKQREAANRKWIIVGASALLLIALIVVSVYFFTNHSGTIKRDTYQLVKLTNDEVYFGKLSNPNKQFVTLDNAYLQAPSDSDDESDDNNITIIKLSATVAKPEDTVHIAREHIVYWENLQQDGKIMQAIQSQQ